MNKLFNLFYLLFLAVAGIGNVFASEASGQDLQTEAMTLTIQEAIQMALFGSPEIRLAEAQTMRAQEAIRESRSLNRPQVDIGTGLAYNNGFPLSIEGSAPSIFQVRASQSFLNKKNNNLIREAEESGKASGFDKESTRNELISKTASAYISLNQARKRIALAAEKIESAQTQQERADSLFQEGKIPPSDITSAKLAVSSARQQLLIAQEQANIAETELKNYIGLSTAASIHTVEPSIMSPAFEAGAVTLYQRALEQAPEIQQAEADIRSKEYHLKAEKGERLPKINIVGEYALFSHSNNYEDYYNRFERNNYLIGLSIQFPIFDGFRTSARMAQSRQEVAEATYRLERFKSDLKLATQKGVSALRIALGARDLADSEAEAIRENIQVGRVLLENGRISDMEFEKMESQLFEKEDALLEAEQVLFQRKLELLNIIGDVSALLQ